MGSTAKTLERIMRMTALGHLQPGSRVCDIGATQLFGDADQAASRVFLNFYADRYPGAKRPHEAEKDLAAIADNGFLGDLLILAGFKYVALDIFHATNTVLFDLNVHEPGPGLAGSFDLVMNFGTTEHVFNQLRAFQSIHALIKVGGICYHDLPMAGYPNHALFRYDPLFFTSLIPANHYGQLLLEITTGTDRPVPRDLKAIGYRVDSVKNVGIEAIVRRVNSDPLRVPLEASTSLSVDEGFDKVGQSDLVQMPQGISVSYGTFSTSDRMSFSALTREWLARARRGIARRLGV
jgi:SAM-dependent methyltransferase